MRGVPSVKVGAERVRRGETSGHLVKHVSSGRGGVVERAQ